MSERSYLTGDMRSLGFRRRRVKGPQRDWNGKSNFRRRSLPEKPHFIKVKGSSVFDPVQLRRLFRHKGFFERPGYAALKERADWVKQYGLRRRLLNVANSTRIKRSVARRLAFKRTNEMRRQLCANHP